MHVLQLLLFSFIWLVIAFMIERRGDQLAHAATRLRETRMELVALLKKKNNVSRRRNASARHMITNDVSRRVSRINASKQERAKKK